MPHNQLPLAQPLTENTGGRTALFGVEQAVFGRIINLLLFQGVWFLAILGAAAGNGWIGAAGFAVFLVVHGMTSATPRADFRIAAIAVVLGAVVETALLQGGLITYASAIPAAGFAPLWLLALWGAFALTMNGCIAWLQDRLMLAAFFGATGGAANVFRRGETRRRRHGPSVYRVSDHCCGLCRGHARVAQARSPI